MASDKSTPYDLVVIGAGISGLLAARSNRHLNTVIFEKSRGVGGRMASRSEDYSLPDACHFDYGAQFFTARHLIFQELCEAWKTKQIISSWSPSFYSEEHKSYSPESSRYKGASRMTDLPKFLAKDIPIQLQKKLLEIRILPNESLIELVSEKIESQKIETEYTKSLCLSCPIPQSLELLKNLAMPKEIFAELQALEYEKCISVTIRSDKESLLPKEGGLWPLRESSFHWIADNQKKGVSKKPLLTFHLKSEQSEMLFETEKDRVFEQLKPEIETYLPEGSSIELIHFHRWRYSKPKQNLPIPFLKPFPDKAIYLCGDAFNGSRVEGAALSGLAVGDQIRRDRLTTASVVKNENQ